MQNTGFPQAEQAKKGDLYYGTDSVCEGRNAGHHGA